MFISTTNRPSLRRLATCILCLAPIGSLMALTLLAGQALAPREARAAETAAVDMSAARQGARVLRLGLQKSAVLKLPAAAKDVIVGSPDMVDVVLKNRNTAYEITGEDSNGKIIGRHRGTGIARPHFWDRARYFNEDRRLAETLERAEARNDTG